MYDKGLAELVILGIGAFIVLVAGIPMFIGYGLAWMLEPRVGPLVWTIHFWSSIGWGVIVAAFFGCAMFPPRLIRP